MKFISFEKAPITEPFCYQKPKQLLGPIII